MMSESTYEPFTLTGAVGDSRVRTSGREKVTGRATFTAEWPIAGVLHAVAVPATIAKGRVIQFDTAVAEAMPGVVRVLTPENAPRLKNVGIFTTASAEGSNRTESTQPVGTTDVQFAGQYLAVAIAETFEAARDAALAVEIEYEKRAHLTDFEAAEADERPQQLMGKPPKSVQGDPDATLEDAALTVDATYTTRMNHHNPIEPHATIAVWDEDAANGEPTLTVYDTVQSIMMSQVTAAKLAGLDKSQVRVVNKYIGGAFGAKGGTWPQAALAILCAMETKRPVKVVVTRRQMYGGTGHRTPTEQRVALGADADGRIHTLIHEGHAATAAKEKKTGYIEAFTMASRMMYAGENRRIEQMQSRTDTQQPTFMRAPAETPGMFALESAMSEMAEMAGVDPVELRIRNDPARDPMEDQPFSSRHLVGCLRAGAKAFGWGDRDPQPRQRREGHWLIGTGVAAATYPAFHFPNTARVTMHRDGRVIVECCTQEQGTGTRTVQEQLTADLLGVSADRVTMELGDTRLPPGNVSGGSATTSSVGGAIKLAVEKMKAELLAICPSDSPLSGKSAEEVRFADGQLVVAMTGEGAAFESLLAAAGKDQVAAKAEFNPQASTPDGAGYSSHSFGATFVEVAVDEAFGAVRVRRMLGCYACGTILNRRTARSQFLGGMVMGIGHALMEETRWDHRHGRITNDNIAEYHVPVNADVPELDVMWINDPDFNASPIGAKGIGEISITGVAAAIGEAIWHATGRRHYETPILPHHVMAAEQAAAGASA